MATIQERIKLLDSMHAKERAIMDAKANDYSGTVDCNRNIKACEAIGIATAEEGILIRILDKISRISNLVRPGFTARVNESVDDAISDARNYLAILQHILKDKRDASSQTPQAGS